MGKIRGSESEAGAPSAGAASTRLFGNSINFLHIVLMVTAAAAPLVVASTYIPVSIGAGAGMATALTYAATTLILLIFSVGFAQMAKRIASAGAFYTFSAQGLGRSIGLSVGFTVLAAYSMISAAIAGGFGFYGAALLHSHFRIDVPWYWVSIVGLALMFTISYFRVTFTARILGVLLALEVFVVLAVAVATVVSGGAQGQQARAFSFAEWGTAPAVGIGFFLAFWSWIGFETTAIYGEEARDPKESVPRATRIAVITLGVFYTFVAYAGVVGYGDSSPAQARTLINQYFFVLADEHTFGFVRTLMDFLVVSGFFACSFAFHNNASRYLFSLGRDGILPRALGRTHQVHKSPHMAAGVQTVIAITTVAVFAICGADPIVHLGTWLPIFCTLAVLLVQLIVCLAVVGYFNRVGRVSGMEWAKTFLAPAVGALAQGVVIYLLINNLTFLAGGDVLVVKLIPAFVAVIPVAGFTYALWLRAVDPQRFALIGELHDEELDEPVVDGQAPTFGGEPDRAPN
ncbi:APC family permease [Nocardia jiangxiensis]|uniref:APC family permease n=1 Tax=Nocardia jiangxiensis TaxID=282685 RepID=UPI0002F28665|nr:APC family permease [Nocardia jiangxiensis]